MFNFLFIFIIIIFIVVLVKNISEWNRNNHSPITDTEAVVALKKISTATHQHPVGGDASGAQGMHISTSTEYYITFRTKDGELKKFRVNEREYSLVSEGQEGKLSFQGSRYIGFERNERRDFYE